MMADDGGLPLECAHGRPVHEPCDFCMLEHAQNAPMRGNQVTESKPAVDTLTYIEGEDSCGCGAHWSNKDDAHELAHIVARSVGWVVHEDEKFLVIAPHMTAREHEHVKTQIVGEMSIPKRSIVRRCEMEMPRG